VVSTAITLQTMMNAERRSRSASEQLELLRKTESRMIIQKVADDTATLRTAMSSAGSQADTASWTNRQSSVGDTVFDFDDTVVNAVAYRRALEHSRSKSEGQHQINRDVSRRTFNTSSDEGYASGTTGMVIQTPSLSANSPSGSSELSVPARPYESVLPKQGCSKSVSGIKPSQPDQNIRRWHSESTSFSNKPSSLGSKRDKFKSVLRRLSTSSRSNLTAASPRSSVTSPTVGSTRGRRGRESDFTTSIDLTSAAGASAPPIVKAAQSGSRFDIETLIENGHDIEARHAYSRQNALAVAAHCGKEDIVDLLIQSNARLNVQDASGSTPLHLAASRGHCAVLRRLLPEQVDIEAKDSNGRTALWVAASNGQLEATQLLIENHARVNARADNQMTALHAAAKRGDEEMAELLISHDADMEARDSTMMAAIHYACEGGHLNVIELLLNNKANIDALGNDRRTPLICAAATGQLLATQLLLRRKASSRCVDEGGMTALHWAAYNGHVEIVDLLSKKKGSLSMVNRAGRTPLHLAAMNSQFAVVEFLLRRNPSLEVRCRSGLTPLHYACRADSPEIVRLLLTSGANMEAQTEGDQSRPIHIAAASGSLRLLSLLCEKGASLDSRDAQGDRALCVACRYGHVAAVEKLLDYGSPLYLKFGTRLHEDSPLCLAVTGGHLPVVSLLLARGASVLRKDEMGWQPLRYAAYYGHPEVLKLLLAHGATSTENGADFGLSAEKIGFAPDARISEERKRQVLDLLRGAQFSTQMQPQVQTGGPRPTMTNPSVDVKMEPTIRFFPQYQSSSQPDSRLNTSTPAPIYELPSTAAEGLPSSRSNTPERMHRVPRGLREAEENSGSSAHDQTVRTSDTTSPSLQQSGPLLPAEPREPTVKGHNNSVCAPKPLSPCCPETASPHYRLYPRSSRNSSPHSTPRYLPHRRMQPASPASSVSEAEKAEINSGSSTANPAKVDNVEAPRPVASSFSVLTKETGQLACIDLSDTESISSVYTAPEESPMHGDIHESTVQ